MVTTIGRKNIKWWDLGLNATFNITRLIYGYEGDNSPRLMNQIIASAGAGFTHHYGLSYGEANEWSAHLELQYSRFFTPAKAVSLDVKLRGLFYETKYDGYYDYDGTNLLDMNLSLNVGVTYYFKYRGWERKSTHTTIYNQYNQAKIMELNEEINRLRNMPVPEESQNTNIVDVLKDIVTFPYLVNFVIDKVEVVNRERVNLGVVAAMMKATPDQKYLITGYADKHTGTVKRNEWLAKNRAKNTFTVLVEEFGVPASQLILDDKGGVENMYYDDPQLSRSAIITPTKKKKNNNNHQYEIQKSHFKTHNIMHGAFALGMTSCQDDELLYDRPTSSTLSRTVGEGTNTGGLVQKSDGTWIATSRVPLVGYGRLLNNMANSAVSVGAIGVESDNLTDLDITNHYSPTYAVIGADVVYGQVASVKDINHVYAPDK